MENHVSSEECKHTALRQLDDATKEGGWMIAVFSVKEGKLFLERTTCEFPSAMFAECRNLLHKNLSEELMPEIQREPLPMANILRMNREENNGETNQSN